MVGVIEGVEVCVRVGVGVRVTVGKGVSVDVAEGMLDGTGEEVITDVLQAVRRKPIRINDNKL